MKEDWARGVEDLEEAHRLHPSPQVKPEGVNDTVDETFTDICSTGGGAQEEKLGQQEEAESLSGQIGLRKNAQLHIKVLTITIAISSDTWGRQASSH